MGKSVRKSVIIHSSGSISWGTTPVTSNLSISIKITLNWHFYLGNLAYRYTVHMCKTGTCSEVLFILAKNKNQHRCPLIAKWLNKLLFTHIMKSYIGWGSSPSTNMSRSPKYIIKKKKQGIKQCIYNMLVHVFKKWEFLECVQRVL